MIEVLAVKPSNDLSSADYMLAGTKCSSLNKDIAKKLCNINSTKSTLPFTYMVTFIFQLVLEVLLKFSAAGGLIISGNRSSMEGMSSISMIINRHVREKSALMKSGGGGGKTEHLLLPRHAFDCMSCTALGRMHAVKRRSNDTI